VQWLLVPRHPQRFDEVAALSAQPASRGAPQRMGAAPRRRDVWIGDSLGEMALYYAWPTSRCSGAASRPWAGRT
jgi:3-deoxy-D-manno-octulosonic-acid transferase